MAPNWDEPTYTHQRYICTVRPVNGTLAPHEEPTNRRPKPQAGNTRPKAGMPEAGTPEAGTQEAGTPKAGTPRPKDQN